MPATDPRAADVVRSGAIRLALFLPQYARDADGALRGLGTGFIAIDMVQALACRLGVAVTVVECPAPHEAIARLRDGEADLAFLGIEPARAAEVDFSPPVFQFDYTFLVPSGSAIHSVADAVRSGTRIGVVDSHASALALRRIAGDATLIGCALPEEAFELIRTGMVDALAFPRDHLLHFAGKLPGARVLEGRYGVNRVAIAVPKGRADWLALVCEFVAEAKASNLVRDAIGRGALDGYEVASAAP